MKLQGKKILLVRLSAMGDVVFNIPLANLLKKNGAVVHWLVSEKGYDIVNSNPCVDKTILAPVEKWKKQKNKLKNFFEYIKILKSLRSEKYDIMIDTQMILKSLIWTVFSNAKRKIVSKSARELSILGGREFIEPLFDDFKLHAVHNYYKFAKYLKLETDEIIKTLPKIPVENKKNVDELLKNLDSAKPILLIAPATTWNNKHWDKDNWKDLILKIDESKYNIIFVGTKNDIGLIEYISGGKFLNLAGKTKLLDLIEILKRTDILISLDSGTTHLGWLCDRAKIIAIFCSTPKERYRPLDNKSIALQGKLACQPCHKKKCPLKTDACVKNPSVEEVLSALNRINS